MLGGFGLSTYQPKDQLCLAQHLTSLLDAKLEIHSEIYSHEQPYVPIIDLTDRISPRCPTLYVVPSDFTYRDISKREVAYPLDKDGLDKVIARLSIMG